jgi:hypothetical protein
VQAKEVDACAATGYGGAMAVKARSKPAKRAKKASTKASAGTNGNGHAVKEYEVITLRIDRQHKAKLLEHCSKRAKQLGKQMSFNRSIIEWIEGL